MNIEKIYYKHYRYVDEHAYPQSLFDFELQHYSRGNTWWQPTCKGGLTECHLVLGNDTEVVGIAECSIKDNFCYAIGREIAHGRAMKIYKNHYGNYDDYKNILSK